MESHELADKIAELLGNEFEFDFDDYDDSTIYVEHKVTGDLFRIECEKLKK